MKGRFAAALPLAAVLFFTLLLGIAHFFLVVPAAFLQPSYPKWTDPGGDEAQMLMGTIALLRDHWRYPLAATGLLSFGAPVSIVFTDSTPWLSILAKALGRGPDGVNVQAVTVLLNFVLQPPAFALFLWAAGVRRLEVLLLGAALGAMLPAWYLRIEGHLALASHWLIALALAITAHAIRRGLGRRGIVAACLLGALALGIHAYLFVMVTAVLLAGFLADIPRAGLHHLTPGSIRRAATVIAAYIAVQAVAALTLGYFAGNGTAGGFGLYSMNLLSPVVPQISGLRLLLTGQAGAVIAANDGMQWEGYNYLGAGLLLVLLAAASVLLLRRSTAPTGAVRRAAIPLALALLALTLLAISNRVFAGQHLLLTIPLRHRLSELVNQVRSSGRLFWTVEYALAGIALALLARARGAGRAAVALLLVAAVGLQFVDTGPLRAGAHASTAAGPEAPLFPTGPWTAPPLVASAVRVLPDFNCAASTDLEPIRQLGLLVVRAGGRLEGGPSARVPDGVCERTRQEATDLPAGPDVVNVLFRASLPVETMRRAAASGRCVGFPQGLVCGPRALASALPRLSVSDASNTPGAVRPAR